MMTQASAFPAGDPWQAYREAHIDAAAVPISTLPDDISTIQASAQEPTATLAATVEVHGADLLAASASGAPQPHVSASASAPLAVSGAPATTSLGLPDAAALARLEEAAPGYAIALLQAEQARDRDNRRLRLARLVSTMVVAVFAIALGQWALVNGANTEALYLSGAGLVGLVTTFLGRQ